MPVASADEHDDDFLMALARLGIRPMSEDQAAGRAGLVSAAHWACDPLNGGAKPQDVANWLSGYNQANNRDFGATDALVLREASLYYCPAYLDAVSAVASRGRPR